MDQILPQKIQLEKAGEYPYTRGIHPDMYTKGRLPTIRKYGGFGTGQELNSHFRSQIELGVTGLSIAYDLPTQMGYDPDDPMSFGEIGVNGVSVAGLRDYERAFEGILPKIVEKGIGVSKTINATAPILLAFYIAAAKKQGIDPKLLRGTIQNDVLKEYLARNTFIYPLEGTLRLVRDVFVYAKENLPKFNTISICGYHMREKGATAVQELAFMFANAIQYVCVALEGGLTPDDLGSQISFFVNVKKDLFEETAKFRAARRIWARIMREGFGAQTESAWKFRVQAYTGGSDLRAEKPQFNIVRDCVRTLAAALAGPQGINTTSFDEALSIPTALSQGIAIDTPYIILLEKGLIRAVDPLGGSRCLEEKTDEIESKVWRELANIAEFSSYQKALASMMRVIESQAYQEQIAEDEGQKKVVGKNVATKNGHLYPAVAIFKGQKDKKIQEQRIEEFLKYKASRDGAKIQTCLQALRASARNKEANLMEAILQGVEAGATLGEVSAALKEVFGCGRSQEPWEPSQPVEVFNEKLRKFVASKAQGQEPILRSSQTYDPSTPPRAGLRPTTYDLKSSRQRLPTADAYSYRLRGAAVAQELAWGLHEAMEIAQKKKLKRIVLKLSSHNDFFEEIAKFRAARVLWQKVIARHEVAKQSHQEISYEMATDPADPRHDPDDRPKLFILAKTAEDTLTKKKPWNNITRSTLQAVQAILGGVDYLEITPFDAPFRKQGDRRWVIGERKTKTSWSRWADQLVKDMAEGLRCEFGLLDAVDPCAGSFYLEELTSRLEHEVSEELRKLSAHHAPRTAHHVLKKQYIRNSLKKAKEMSKENEAKIVGVNVQILGISPRPRLIKQGRNKR